MSGKCGSSCYLIFFASYILALRASDSGMCSLDSAGSEGCDMSMLIQSKVMVSESLSNKAEDVALKAAEEQTGAASKKAIVVQCKFSLVEQDDNPDTGEALTYGMCEDDDEEVYYIRDDSQSEDLDPGAMVSVELEEIEYPTLPGIDQGPWKAEGRPFFRIIKGGASLLMSAEEVAAKSRAKYGLKQEGVKEIGFLLVLVKYTDQQDLWFTNVPKWTKMTEDLIWKGTYSKPEDWSTDPVLIKLRNTGLIGSFADALEKSSGGKLRAPERKGRVVTVQMGKTWAEEVCSWKAIGRAALKEAKKQFPGLDPGAYDFREIFMPHKYKPECKGTILTGWNFVRSGVALWGCGHPDVLPNPGGCIAWLSGGDTFVRSHELGHNLGMLHNTWLNPDGSFKWLDPQSWNGGAEKLVDLPAPDRHQLSLLTDKQGEVLKWTQWNVAPVTISSISRPVAESGAGFMAVRWPCPMCSGAKARTGFLWLQFRGNTSYSAHNFGKSKQNKFYVLYQPGYRHKRYGPGTTLLAIFGIESPAYTPKHSPYSVHICDLGNDFAKVSLGATPSEAKERCSQNPVNLFYSTTTTTTPAPTLAPNLFKKLSRKTCGWSRGSPVNCRRKNDARIGKGGRKWDGPVAADRAEYICGTKCLSKKSCGGFMYDKRRKRCFYRKIATCGVKTNRHKECYQRLASAPSRTAPPPNAFAIHKSKDCGSTSGKWSKCPGRNKGVKIGAKKRTWDWGQATWEDTVSTTCGSKCLASSQCGGFVYNKRNGKCYYKKYVDCGRPQKNNGKYDCWMKSN